MRFDDFERLDLLLEIGDGERAKAFADAWLDDLRAERKEGYRLVHEADEVQEQIEKRFK